MKRSLQNMALVLSMALLAACATAPRKDLALERVKNDLKQLKANPELAGYAPLALGEAERALRTAEQSSGNEYYRIHLVYMADHRIKIAQAMAEREQQQKAYDKLEKERSAMLIRASKLEAKQARDEAERARLLVATTTEDAERARAEKEAALKKEAEAARAAKLASEEAKQARRLAKTRASEAEYARKEADIASQQVDSLTRQLKNLQLRQTEKGVVVTLGDVLFDPGKATLLDSARSSLQEVVDLLQTEPEKKIRVEGHTDSSGDAAANLKLSQQRAQSVRDALVKMGVAADRIKAVGMGEDFPIASNKTAEGRARNRRVDVILLDN